MREIKFRAWDKDFKQMHPVIGIHWEGEFIDYGTEGETGLLNDFILMQYTGIKDKNGREIYEGDIISVLYYRKATILPVAWGIDGWWASGKGWFKSLYDVKNTAEVIGNIYENANLLEATDAKS